MTRGVFISFEGGEASGKSLQASRLSENLRAEGHDVLLTREPGGTPAGERIREIVLHAKEVALAPEAQVLLFSAARAQHVRDVIRPALAAGRIVIADRFYDSTLAYQAHGHGAELAGVRAVTTFAVGDTRPDRTFLLDLPVDATLARLAGDRGRAWDRFEPPDREFHQRIRDGYLRLAAAEPSRIVVINADRDVDAIARDIKREVAPLLSYTRAT